MTFYKGQPNPGFKKGQSGNPTGKPKDLYGIAEAARGHGPNAIETLVRVMNDLRAPHNAQVAAANALLDRGYGKPPQTNDLRVRAAGRLDEWSDDELLVLRERIRAELAGGPRVIEAPKSEQFN
jgi:hypothetical protein